MRACGKPRVDQEGTWISEAMVQAYATLHRGGYAHSVEAWREGRLVGGLYGLSLGGAFFGESMFSLERDASKVAFAALCERCWAWDFAFIDAQVETEHLRNLGAGMMAREDFLLRLNAALQAPTRRGVWTDSGGLFRL